MMWAVPQGPLNGSAVWPVRGLCARLAGPGYPGGYGQLPGPGGP